MRVLCKSATILLAICFSPLLLAGDLVLTLTEFSARLNKAMVETKLNYSISDFETNSRANNEYNDHYLATIGPHAAVSVRVLKTTGNLDMVFLVAQGDGTPSSGLSIMLVGAAVMSAAALDSDRLQVFKRFLEVDTKVFEIKNTILSLDMTIPGNAVYMAVPKYN